MNVDDYLQLPYTTLLKRDQDGDFVAKVKELRGCVAHGETEALALEALASMKRLWVESCLADGDKVPLPEEEVSLPSGKWLVRVPKSLHASLIRCAEEDEVSLNQFVGSILAKEVGFREGRSSVLRIDAHALGAHEAADRWSALVDQSVPKWQTGTLHVGSIDTSFFERLSGPIRPVQQSMKLEATTRGDAKHAGYN